MCASATTSTRCAASQGSSNSNVSPQVRLLLLLPPGHLSVSWPCRLVGSTQIVPKQVPEQRAPLVMQGSHALPRRTTLIPPCQGRNPQLQTTTSYSLSLGRQFPNSDVPCCRVWRGKPEGARRWCCPGAVGALLLKCNGQPVRPCAGVTTVGHHFPLHRCRRRGPRCAFCLAAARQWRRRDQCQPAAAALNEKCLQDAQLECQAREAPHGYCTPEGMLGRG